MEKAKILEKYKNEEQKLIISKLFDKIQMVEKQKKIQCTDFLSPLDIKMLENVLHTIKYENYIIYGGTQNAQRKIIIIFPEKLESIISKENFDFNTICNCIRITNNNENYEHKIYLGGLIKLGVKREKIGDIIVYNNGADIIVSKDVIKFLVSNIQELTRFKKSNIEIINMEEIVQKEQEYKEFKIIVSSLRLDNIISELANTSRNKACDLLKQERVFVNYESEIKSTKQIKEEDLITIRGIGKFIIDKIEGNTRSGRHILIVKKFM